MPFRRSSLLRRKSFRPRRFKKSGWFNRKYSVKQLALKAWKGIKTLRGMVNVEKKFISTTISESPGSTAVLNCLNICSQGNDDNNRQGDSILAKHCTILGNLTVNASNTGSDVVRCIVFVDKENRGAFPSATDLLTSSSVNSQKSLDNLDRFVTLKDMRFVLTPSTGVRPQVPFKIYLPLHTHLKYAGNAGDITDVRQNSIFILWLGIENTNKTVISATTRLAFYDN